MTASNPEMIQVFAEHCVLAGKIVPDGHYDDPDESDDVVEIEVTPEVADFYDRKKSPYGWRIAKLIRDRLGIVPAESDGEDDE